MPNQRLTRVNELLKREIANFMYRAMNQNGFDLSAVTVTHVITAQNLHHTRVCVSIRGDKSQKRNMLRLLNQRKKAFTQHLRKNIKIKYIPRLSFELDSSIEAGDRVLDLLAHMESDSE